MVPKKDIIQHPPKHNTYPTKAVKEGLRQLGFSFLLQNIGPLIIRIGFWGPLYYNYKKEPPPTLLLVIVKGPVLVQVCVERIPS